MRKTPVLVKYVPHGVDTRFFKPLSEDEKSTKEFVEFKKQLNADDYEFIVFFNSRNMRRKQIPDTIYSWKLFLDTLSKEKAEKCLLLLHTQPVDDNGTDIPAVVEYFFGKGTKNVKLSAQRFPPHILNYLYNIADLQILLSSNEGWGLSLTEAMAAATPILANVQGGMQDQMRFEDTEGGWLEFSKELPSNHTGIVKKHSKWAFPVFPNNRSLQGSPMTPYIWDTRCSPEDVVKQLTIAHQWGRERLKEFGLEASEWVRSEEAKLTAKMMGDNIIEGLNNLFETWTPREQFELINSTELNKENKYNYNLI